MKFKALRLLSLYGLFTLFIGVLGVMSEDGKAPLHYLLLAAVGAGAIVSSFAMKDDTIGAFAAAPVVTGLGALAGLFYGVRYWLALGTGASGVFVPAVVFSLVGMFSVLLTPTMRKAWKFQRRLYNLLDGSRGGSSE